ncbi:mannose-6-phosphate isomerase, type 1 [Rubritalea squalenifaciens DSM 18772]|uniref:Mannose-6-phosphate isomerase, type 1 n=1 Tax=Rubritalea squalenifaciens DSM 18772 TaxID=1123071 RepID=A0A1M6QJX0_9BACT|nr:type I phosphomannose isomerase catalytic subunit [Rubritalea squalenifaciens]SHK20363.1 mannose-6-phosphate isomerase, type 1 [Rubritalea squalenifaciens DSM 18772]
MKKPITFSPHYMERVWGGRSLESTYARKLPKADTPYGESWEISDRPEAQSVVDHGHYAGKSLHDLWRDYRGEIFGEDIEGERFPLLIKILDARSDLSIQVHPPAQIAPAMGGEPKTEMWYIADADPNAKIYVGLKKGVTKESFEQALKEGRCEETVHAIHPKTGESIHIPSGRLHAIGSGLLIYEIQQNSDTTYRVYDWNRLGLDGKPRDLHIEESLECIDFEDFEPTMDTPQGHTLAKCPYYHVEKLALSESASVGNPDPLRFSIITIVSGKLMDSEGRAFTPGSFLLMPKGATPLTATKDTTILQTTIPD